MNSGAGAVPPSYPDRVDIREIDRSDEDQLRQFWLVGKEAEDAYRPYDFYAPFESARAAYVEGILGHS